MTPRSWFLAALALLGGCASATDSPALHATLPSATLVLTRKPPELDVPLVLAATPVQLGAWMGPESLPDGQPALVTARVPQGVPTLHAIQSPTIEPSVIGTQIHPRFDFRAVPLLPYGAFWVGLANTTDRPIEVRPSQLQLLLGQNADRPITDGGALSGRWSLSLSALVHTLEGKPRVGEAVRQLHDSLPVMGAPIVVLPHQAWRGFVVFDTGAYTADEYDELLARAGRATLRLEQAGQAPLEVEFQVAERPLDAVCLPGTTRPTFRRCEILAVEAQSGAIRSRDASHTHP